MKSTLPSILGSRTEFPTLFPLRREIDRLFDDFVKGMDLQTWPAVEEESTAFMPKLDVRETEKDIVVTAELPGVNERDVEVTLSDDILSIRGEKKEEKEEKLKGYYRMERSYGSFHRSIRLPQEIETDKVQAVFKNGVITITMPKDKAAQKQAKQIQVKSA